MSQDKEYVEVHVLIAVPSPLTTIIFDEEDRINSDIKAINTGNYDYLKLQRVTLNVDSKIPELTDKNIGIAVSYTGAFLFPRIKTINKLKIIDSVNNLLFCLFLGGIKFDAISPEDIGYGLLYKTGYFICCGGATGSNYNNLFKFQQKHADPMDTVRLLEPRTYTKKDYYKALNKGLSLREYFPEINASIFFNGITFYEKYQLSSSLSFIWTTIEILIDKMWRENILKNAKGIKWRKEFLKSNSWNISHKIEIIYQNNIIDINTYVQLDEARKARNKFIHTGTNPDVKTCKTALNVTFKLISLLSTDYKRTDYFENEFNSLNHHEKRVNNIVEPRYWIEILHPPGSKGWGDKPYPKYPEIELVPKTF